QAVEVEDPLEVVELVLQDVGEVALGAQRAGLAVEVLVLELDHQVARHLLGVEAGEAEAAVAAELLALALHQPRVDDHVLAALLPAAAALGGRHLALLGVGVVVGARLHLQGHEQALGHAGLRGGEAHAVGGVHRLDHVGGEALQVSVELRDLAGAAAKHRVAVVADQVYQGSSRLLVARHGSTGAVTSCRTAEGADTATTPSGSSSRTGRVYRPGATSPVSGSTVAVTDSVSASAAGGPASVAVGRVRVALTMAASAGAASSTSTAAV